jgi:hypothetical protein
MMAGIKRRVAAINPVIKREKLQYHFPLNGLLKSKTKLKLAIEPEQHFSSVGSTEKKKIIINTGNFEFNITTQRDHMHP